MLIGDNGAGKTSLLEAIYLTATTRSFRTADLGACVRHGAAELVLRGEFTGAGGERSTLAVTVGENGARRARNGKPASHADHLAVQPILAWTSGERELLTGPPAARRRFLDRGLVAERPAALADLAAHRRALEQKRALLASRPRRGAVEPWNEVLAAAAAALARQRAAYVERLRDELESVLGESGLSLPPVTMRYLPSPSNALDGEPQLRAALAASLDEEIRRRQPLVGPQRDDLAVGWGGSRLRDVASAGERKALGLALLVAQARVLERVREPPLLVLDDADTELDERALSRLWKLFAGRQIVASSNRPGVWEDLPIARRFSLSSGRLAEP